MRRHLTNAGYGVLDYVSYPAGMLLVAPIVLRRLGAAEYGLWMATTAIISAGGIIASGFCNASIQRIAFLRGSKEFSRIPTTMRSMLGINLALGVVLAAAVWIAAPYIAVHIARSQAVPVEECLIAIRVATAAILVRAVESVAVGAQRAFEQYRGTVQISTAVRLLTLASAAILALLGYKTPAVLAATAAFMIWGAFLQFRQVRALLGTSRLWPGFDAVECRSLLGMGVFAWMQALSGVAFGQLDRLFLGIALGASTVASYSLCVQFAHPIFGLTGASLNFLFPYLSGRAGAVSNAELRQIVWKAIACNALLVAAISGALLIFGHSLLRIWAGDAVAQKAALAFVPIVAGTALLGLSVTGTYALQALGSFRAVAYFSLASKAAMLVLMLDLLHSAGLQGLAWSRVCYGFIALLIYIPLFRQLSSPAGAMKTVSSLSNQLEVQEAPKL
jgi:O-antigen/teichoic acid export membrane protein